MVCKVLVVYWFESKGKNSLRLYIHTLMYPVEGLRRAEQNVLLLLLLRAARGNSQILNPK